MMELTSSKVEVKMLSGQYRIPVEVWKESGRFCFSFGFQASAGLRESIKLMSQAKWHGYDEINPRKIWSIADCARNRFQLERLLGQNPYARYDSELDESWVPEKRYNYHKQKEVSIFKHQRSGAAHIYQRRGSLVTSEMGTGKSLMIILAMERAAQDFLKKYGSHPEIWYVAPRMPLKSFERELIAWQAFIRPTKMMTYEALVKEITNWEPGRKAPTFVFFDESSKLKNSTAQRTRAAQHLADSIRSDWPEDWIVCLASGSPAPKSPVDWWSQAEIACPGFLVEGDQNKFKSKLAVIKQTQGIDGAYPRLVTWRDSEDKCAECGELLAHGNHIESLAEKEDYHHFVKSVNEVARLYRRLKGLAIIFFKKDCLDLPEKNYRQIELKPHPSIMRVAAMIVKTSPTTIEGLTRLRELSDGFQYEDQKSEEKESCHRCKGTGKSTEYIEIPNTCPNCHLGVGQGFGGLNQCPNHLPKRDPQEITCPLCAGTGLVHKIRRIVVETKCPKDQAVVDVLDEHEDVGRIVIYAGFTGSVDRCVKTCLRQKWAVIRVDQGKEVVFDANGNIQSGLNVLEIFQDLKDSWPRVAFVANAASAGMGLTLTASPSILYYSNTFNAEDRIQSEDRIHRPGMDLNRGATIIDLIHLPSDQKILDNLQKKRDLQAMTLGDFSEALKLDRLEE